MGDFFSHFFVLFGIYAYLWCILYTVIWQQKQCFNYKNLQPLWQDDNFSKNSFYNGILQRKYISK